MNGPTPPGNPPLPSNTPPKNPPPPPSLQSDEGSQDIFRPNKGRGRGSALCMYIFYS
jgi:hypothetical protein